MKKSDNTKVNNKKQASRKKSRAEIFQEAVASLTEIPDIAKIAEPNYRAIEDRIFPVKVKTGKIKKNGEDVSTISFTDSGSTIIPNDPIYLGFRQPPPNRITHIPEQILEHFGNRIYFIGWQACAYLAEHPFIYKACMMPGDDALACGYKVTPRNKKSKVASAVMDMIEDDDFGLDDTLRKFEYNKRVFGFGFAIPCFEKPVDMEKPLVDYTQVSGNRFLGWSIVDPYWLTPQFDEESQTNPAYKDYFRPTWWRVNSKGTLVHKSWVVKVDNTMMADITAPTYLWGGISIPQLCYERVWAADKTANEAPMVALSKRLLAVTNCNLRKMAGNSEYAKRQFDNLRYGRDNWGVIALDRNQDIKQVDTVLSEFNQTITTQYQLFCGIVEVPAPKMMMAPLTGFANSGQYENKVYAANVKKIQDNEFNKLIKRTYRFAAATFGEDIRFDVEWGEMDIPTITEQAEIEYEKSRAKKFAAEAKAVTKMAGTKSAETHKSAKERIENE